MQSLRSNRSFLRLFVGRLTTNAGDSLYYIAAMWLVWELTQDPLFTGIAGFLTQAPNAAQFLAGPLVDRWSLRRVLVGAQAFQAVAVLAVPLAAFTGHLSVWVVLVVMPILAIVDQFTSPAQTAALPKVVTDEQLTKANSLYATTARAADTVFNALSGVLVAIFGAVALYLLDAVTFAFAAVLYFGLELQNAVEESEENEAESAESEAESADRDDADEPSAWENYRADLAVGSRYLRGSILLTIVAGAMVVNFVSAAMMAVLPAFAASFDGASSYGLLMAAFSVGTLAGTAGVSLVDDLPYGPVAAVSLVTAGSTLGGAAVVNWFPATLGLIALSAIPMGVFNILFQSMLQSTVTEELLGRVSSLVGSGVAVTMPFGSLVGGAVADWIGPAGLILVQAVCVVLLGVSFALHPRLRALPPVADADEAILGLGDGETTPTPSAGATTPETTD
jgi:MFS family permease